VNSKGKYVPQLAVRVPTVENGLVKTRPFRVTYEIRPEARWSDGRPVTSADAIFTWQTYMNPKNDVASREGWKEIRTIRAQGAKRFTIFFARPFAPHLDVFSLSGGYYLFPKHVLQGKDFNTVWNNGGLVGTGPYVLKEFVPDTRVVLERNARYWDKRPGVGPHVDRLVFNCVGTTASQLNAFRSGEANVVNPPPLFDLIPQVREVPNSRVQSRPATTWEHIAFNVKVPPVDDVRVRQAIAYAIDRRELTTNLLLGQVLPLQSQLVSYQLGYKPVFSRYTYNVNRAKQLLESAGWRLGSDGIYQKDGKRLSIDVKTTAGNTQRQRNIALFASQAKRAGIELKYVPEPATQKLFSVSLPQGDFVMAVFAFSGSIDPDPSASFTIAQIPTAPNFNGQNYYRWDNRRGDAAIRASQEALDATRRARLLGRYQDVLASDVPIIPLYQRPNVLGFTKTLRGPDENPTQVEAYWNTERWNFERGRS